MNWINAAISRLILQGKITVDIPGIDEEMLANTLHGAAEGSLKQAADILCDEELSDRKKVEALAELLLVR